MTQFSKTLIISLISLLSFSNFASAETTMSAEGQYIFNSLGFYLGGVLVAFMAAGFCMLESGLVTTKSVSTIAAKNIGKFAICSLIFFFCGYNLVPNTTINPPTATMKIAAKGDGANGSAVTATRPPIAPFNIRITSVLPNINLVIIAAAITPPQAARLVLINILDTATASSNVPIAS